MSIIYEETPSTAMAGANANFGGTFNLAANQEFGFAVAS